MRFLGEQQGKYREKLLFRLFQFGLLVLVIIVSSFLIFVGIWSVSSYGGVCVAFNFLSSPDTEPCSLWRYFLDNLQFWEETALAPFFIPVIYIVLLPILITTVLLGIIFGLIQLIKKRNSGKLITIRDDKNLSKDNQGQSD